MKIITSNPILEEKDFYQDEWYSNASAARRNAKKRSRKEQRAKKGTVLQRVNKGVQNLRQSGILDSLSSLGQQNVGGVGAMDMENMQMVDTTPIPLNTVPQNEGMSNGAKIAIGIGIAAVVGVGIYFVAKKLKTPKKG